MLKVIDHYWGSDTGRQRHHNEDSYYANPPVFVVADGMGGAQAGEVASDMVVQAFRSGLPAEGSAEERLAVLIRGVNERIHDTARTDKQRAGMGTTVVSALLGEHDLSVAHVGDSRIYLLRGDELRPLTRDHSLVQTLIDQGRLTVEEAQFHPQRSIITRALGPEPAVDVETHTYGLQAGDVVLLCSDGLTSMIDEQAIEKVLRDHSRLEETGRALIGAANAAGGRDNITVILFRLGHEGDEVEPPVEQPTQANAPVTLPPMAAVPPPGGTGATTAPGPPDAAAKPVTAFIPAIKAGAPAPPAPPVMPPPAALPDRRLRPEPPPSPPADSGRRGRRRERARGRSLRRRLVGPLVLAAFLALVLGGGWLATRNVFFVGTDARGMVTIFRGVPYDLPLGAHLYEKFYVSGVPAQTIPAPRRRQLLDHSWRSQQDAESLVDDLELGKLAGQ